MNTRMAGEIKARIQEKTTDELLSIWTKNDRDEWSEETFEGIRQVLTERGLTVPPQNPPPDVQRKLDVAEQLTRLPILPLKKAIRLDRYFRGWRVVLELWLVFGFIGILGNVMAINEYEKAIANIRFAANLSPYYSVAPQFAEIVKRVVPHLPALERLKLYFLLAAIFAVPAWGFTFPVRKRFVRRQREGPKYLLVILAVQAGVHAFGAFMTLPIPMADTIGFMNLFVIRMFPVVVGIMLLTLTPFFGKTASVFYQYTQVDPECFAKHGAGIDVLKSKMNG